MRVHVCTHTHTHIHLEQSLAHVSAVLYVCCVIYIYIVIIIFVAIQEGKRDMGSTCPHACSCQLASSGDRPMLCPISPLPSGHSS